MEPQKLEKKNFWPKKHHQLPSIELDVQASGGGTFEYVSRVLKETDSGQPSHGGGGCEKETTR